MTPDTDDGWDEERRQLRQMRRQLAEMRAALDLDRQLREELLARPVWYGARLGIYQAHALGGPVAALLMFVTGQDAMTLLFAVGAAFGWAGWHRDYGLRWHP